MAQDRPPRDRPTPIPEPADRPSTIDRDAPSGNHGEYSPTSINGDPVYYPVPLPSGFPVARRRPAFPLDPDLIDQGGAPTGTNVPGGPVYYPVPLPNLPMPSPRGGTIDPRSGQPSRPGTPSDEPFIGTIEPTPALPGTSSDEPFVGTIEPTPALPGTPSDEPFVGTIEPSPTVPGRPRNTIGSTTDRPRNTTTQATDRPRNSTQPIPGLIVRGTVPSWKITPDSPDASSQYGFLLANSNCRMEYPRVTLRSGRSVVDRRQPLRRVCGLRFD